jgi:hypothetical protein
MSKHDEPPIPFATSSEALWAEVPEPIRRDVELHVLAHLPADLLTKWRDQHARGVCIGSDDPFFHFDAGMAVRNLCREQLTDGELEACGFLLNWDNCYGGVLAALAGPEVVESTTRQTH